MVFDTLVHSLWKTTVGAVKKSTGENNNNDNNKKTLHFPQGARYLDYRENKNIRGTQYLTMSSPEMMNASEKAKHIENINKKKFILEKTANSSMQGNLDNIENFTEKRPRDPDDEYYRQQSNQNMMKRITEEKVFSCLTCKDTSISEHNTVLFKNMPYTEYTKPEDNETPWELQTMNVKTSPDVLRNVNLINNNDRNILKNIFRQ